MDKLERLIQDELGTLYRADGRELHPQYTVPKGKIRPLVVANPCLDISNVIDEMIERKSFFIPEGANAYVASDFSGDTQHLRASDSDGGKKVCSVYAIQFYYACNALPLLD